MSEELVLFVTVDNHDTASRLATALVEKRLAACVNIISNIESVYRWEGKVCTDSELLLIIKTDQSHYIETESSIKNLHPYTTPEIIALPIKQGSAEYLNWLRDSLS